MTHRTPEATKPLSRVAPAPSWTTTTAIRSWARHAGSGSRWVVPSTTHPPPSPRTPPPQGPVIPMTEPRYKQGDTVGDFRLVTQTDVDFANAVAQELEDEINRAADSGCFGVDRLYGGSGDFVIVDPWTGEYIGQGDTFTAALRATEESEATHE